VGIYSEEWMGDGGGRGEGKRGRRQGAEAEPLRVLLDELLLLHDVELQIAEAELAREAHLVHFGGGRPHECKSSHQGGECAHKMRRHAVLSGPEWSRAISRRAEICQNRAWPESANRSWRGNKKYSCRARAVGELKPSLTRNNV